MQNPLLNDETAVRDMLKNGYGSISFELAVPYYDGVVQGLWLATQNQERTKELLQAAMPHDNLLTAGFLYTTLASILEQNALADKPAGATLQ
jgi:hypothetical protein